MPEDPFANYVPRTAFGIGMLHGIGAETPTQVLIFVTAAGVSGKAGGLLLLAAFLVGLLSSNSVVALAGTFGCLGATRNFRLYVGVSCITALFSLVIGSLFVFGSAASAPRCSVANKLWKTAGWQWRRPTIASRMGVMARGASAW